MIMSCALQPGLGLAYHVRASPSCWRQRPSLEAVVRNSSIISILETDFSDDSADFQVVASAISCCAC